MTDTGRCNRMKSPPTRRGSSWLIPAVLHPTQQDGHPSTSVAPGFSTAVTGCGHRRAVSSGLFPACTNRSRSSIGADAVLTGGSAIRAASLTLGDRHQERRSASQAAFQLGFSRSVPLGSILQAE